MSAVRRNERACFISKRIARIRVLRVQDAIMRVGVFLLRIRLKPLGSYMFSAAVLGFSYIFAAVLFFQCPIIQSCPAIL